MYSQDDINAAVAGGALTEEAAASLLAFVEANRAPEADEEVRLLSGFNDIFVSIAAAMMLLAVGLLLIDISRLAAGLCVAATAWGLSEYFTRLRRMALPSMLLLLAFMGGAGLAGVEIGNWMMHGSWVAGHSEMRVIAAGMLFASVAAAGHWFRFRVPVAIAVLIASGLASAMALLVEQMPDLIPRIPELTLTAGCLMFAAALWWDASDPARITRRSDTAFWLHLAAAPMIVHPIFSMVGLLGTHGAKPNMALVAIAIYVALAIVALIIDRRAVLVSALAYVLYATSSLLQATGSLTTTLAMTGLVIGSALLMLSVWWRPLRAPLIGLMPQTARRCLPAV